MRVVISLCDRGGSRGLHTPGKMLPLAEPARAKVELAPESPFGACTGLNSAIWRFSS